MTASACSNGVEEARNTPEYGLERSRMSKTALAIAIEPTASAITEVTVPRAVIPKPQKRQPTPSDDRQDERIGNGSRKREGHLHSRLTERVGR